MGFTALRSHFNVKRKAINSKYLTLRSFRLYHAQIVARKNVKNGKNNLELKNKRRMNIINANNNSYLNKPAERWRLIDNIIISIVIEGMIVTGNQHLVVVYRVVVLLVIIPCWKNKSIYRPRN